VRGTHRAPDSNSISRSTPEQRGRPEDNATPARTALGESSGRTAYIENGVGFSPTDTDPPLPFRLEPGSSATWWVDAAAVSAGVVASKLKPGSKVHMEVALGTGKTIKTKSIAWVNR
jgi:hypothetical protein